MALAYSNGDVILPSLCLQYNRTLIIVKSERKKNMFRVFYVNSSMLPLHREQIVAAYRRGSERLAQTTAIPARRFSSVKGNKSGAKLWRELHYNCSREDITTASTI